MSTPGESVQAEWKAEAGKVPQADRQAFLDALWAGKNVREAYTAAGISFDAAMGLLALNIEQHEYHTLRKVAA